jgi:hypothetical protein
MGSAMDIDVVGALASGCIPRPMLPLLKAAIPASRRLPVGVDAASSRNDPQQQVNGGLQL